jgi:hypothetical protein
MCLLHVSSIFKIISPKTVGTHCVLTEWNWKIIKFNSFKPQYIATYLFSIQLYEQKWNLSRYIDLPPQIAMNKQWIWWTYVKKRRSDFTVLTPKTGSPNVVCAHLNGFNSVISECKLKYQVRLPANCENIIFLTHIFQWNFLNVSVCKFIELYLFSFSTFKDWNPGFQSTFLCVGNCIGC